jgi:hypothetical protein
MSFCNSYCSSDVGTTAVETKWMKYAHKVAFLAFVLLLIFSKLNRIPAIKMFKIELLLDSLDSKILSWLEK